MIFRFIVILCNNRCVHNNLKRMDTDNLSQQISGYATQYNTTQMMSMALYPVITSLCLTIFQSIIMDIKNFVGYIFTFLFNVSVKLCNKYIFRRYDEHNEFHVTLSSTEYSMHDVYDKVYPEGFPLIWYLNKKCMLAKNSLKTAKVYKKSNLSQHSEYSESEYDIEGKKIERTTYYIPIIRDAQQNNNISEPSKPTDDSSFDYGKKKDTFTLKTSIGSESIEIAPDIFLEIREKTTSGGTSHASKVLLLAVLKSNKKTIAEIGEFVNTIEKNYEENQIKKKNKLYVYNGTTKKTDYDSGRENQVSSFSCFDLDPSQSFDNLFIKNKDKIIEDIKGLNDVEFFKNHGIKRKVSQLYVGPPGSGKTCFVTAIAKMTGRSIVYIPISRIKNNTELQNIIYERTINGIKYDMSELIFLADELDSLESSQKLTKTETQENHKEKNNSPTIVINSGEKTNPVTSLLNDDTDKLNIGIILNILDGNNDQEDMILIGTANSKTKLDKGLYRTGRMDLIEFEYMDRDDIRQMIEHYCKTTLSDEQFLKINNSKTVQSLNLKNMCIRHLKHKRENFNIDELIDEINELYENAEENNIVYPKLDVIKKENDSDVDSETYNDHDDSNDKHIDMDENSIEADDNENCVL